MKKNLLVIAISFILTGISIQNNLNAQSINYEAAVWKTVFLDKPNLISCPVPPDDKKTLSELLAIKQNKFFVDAKKLAVIKYWDAGAPSYRWNQIAPSLISPSKFDVILRNPIAWMNIAIYDATILAWKDKIKYKRMRPKTQDHKVKTLVNNPKTYSYPCEHTVTAAAAATVLAYFFPEKADSLIQLARDASQSRIDAGVQFPSDAEAAWKLGEQVANAIIEKAKNDGSAKSWKGELNKDTSKWVGSFPMGINLTLYTPMILTSNDQFRPLPPPDFSKDMDELKNFKAGFKTNAQAYFWAINGGYDYWSELASQKMFEYRISDDAPTASLIYTVLHVAYHDATIGIMDAKYAYWGIRPNQYDKTYKPLISTPPFPGYPSGHAAGAATTSAVLEYFFPADAKKFQQLAKDCAESRFYAGIHFRSDNEAGTQMGAAMGKYIVETWMKNLYNADNHIEKTTSMVTPLLQSAN